MSDVETLVYTTLTGDAGVAALVGTRVYPAIIPQDAALPALAYQRISSQAIQWQDGSAAPIRPRIQVTAVADDYSEAKGLAAAVRSALNGVSSGQILSSFMDTDADGFTDTSDLYTVRMDFLIWHDGLT